MSDNINHPSHYSGSIECIDAMEQCFGNTATKDFCLLNAFKYLWRCNSKHETPIEDVKKSAWYLNKYISLSESESDIPDKSCYSCRFYKPLPDDDRGQCTLTLLTITANRFCPRYEQAVV